MTLNRRGCAQFAPDGLMICCPGWRELPGLFHGITTREMLAAPGRQDLFETIGYLRRTGVVPTRFTLGGRQVHGDKIVALHKPVEFGHHPPGFRWEDATQIGEFADTDALVTSLPGPLLAIQTADCLPVFLIDTATRMAGLAHCGWRGLAAGLAGKTARRMQELGARAGRIEAWLGPCIRVDHYEVSAELAEQFREACPGQTVTPDGRHLDLPAVARWQLQQAGLLPEKIYDSGECTFADPERYHSYRGQGEEAGRMISLIGFAPVDVQ